MDQYCDGKSKKPGTKSRRCRCSATMLTMLLFVITNSVSVLLSSGAGAFLLRRYKPDSVRLWAWDDSAALLDDLNATQSALAATHAQLADLHARLGTASSLLETLLAGMAARDGAAPAEQRGAWWARELSGELKLAVGSHRSVTGDALPAVGHACSRFQDDLERYMEYKPGGECPSDEALAHQLMRNGCDPLPRRRCRPPSPARYVQPAPLPKSLWTIPPDTTVVWDAYRCKNYSCLAHGGGEFDLRGREKGRWMRDDGALTYSIDGVLAARPNGTVRIGLDIGGVSGTFAARMRERGVTVVTTTSMNSGGPSGSLIASRGLVPVHVSPAHRLPFFDGTLDIVHWTPELGSRPPPVTDVSLEFAVFDIYRVMRPGGLLWLDHFVFSGEQLSATTDRVGFRRVRWNTGKKLVSALLEKPMT
ncbi:probable methyltransferase At1g29790 [Oryza brachyantha]|uniref:probable methyltransferase At1g29790 n=1 Tax=Oryza brachyantha TaxID=4533 RepID=UPI001AD9BA85|nr:probable methyltransferase At1g29790 [Oryza brachyantha]